MEQVPGQLSAAEAPDDRYRRLIERSHVGLFQTGRDGEIRWVNEAAAHIVGYPSSQAFIDEVGDIRAIYLDPSRRDEFQLEAERRGEVNGFEYEIKRPDGSNRWISVSAIAMRAEDGSVEGFEGSVIDITDSKLLQAAAAAISSDLEPNESVERFADVLRRVIPFRQLSLSVIDGDRYRRVVSISSSNDHLPLPTDEWVPLAGNPTGEAVRTKGPVVVQDTGAVRWEFDRRLAEVGVGSYALFPLMNGESVFATFAVGLPDKDGFDEATLALLAKHVSAVAQAVKNILLFEAQREAVAHLTELDRMKNEFFADVSHDLRHPLTVMLGITETLVKDWDAHADERKKELIAMTAQSAKSMSELLTRDLEVALIESGEMRYELERFDLADVVSEVGGLFSTAHPDRTLELSIPDDLPSAFGDARRQNQILQNLLSNAHKFSPADGAIKIVVTSRQNELEVSVADEGSGINDDEKDRLFRRLSRLERTGPGTGLGLFITRSMVEAQGGRIWVDSLPGDGATFTYTVPVVASPEKER